LFFGLFFLLAVFGFAKTLYRLAARNAGLLRDGVLWVGFFVSSRFEGWGGITSQIRGRGFLRSAAFVLLAWFYKLITWVFLF
jgi:hypothetical protein